MTQRLDIAKLAPEAYKAVFAATQATRKSGLEASLLHLVDLRASQINGCAFCIDMHWKEARHAGVPEHKLALLPAWREAPVFTDRERAALEWTESLTLIASNHVPDEVYRIVREQFSEAEIANLTVAIGTINTWNRIAISSRKTVPVSESASA